MKFSHSGIRVLSIFGTRPEAVKMAPVVRCLERTPGVESLVCVTAQHRQMLDQVLYLFDIKPDIDLNLMTPDQSLAELTAAIFTNLEPVLKDTRPDWVFIQGDTTTVMATALLAFYHRIRVGHVEAGLRTWDKWQPFPEEINRQVASLVTDLHFAPTEWARQNLLRQNVPSEKIAVTGNPVIDALQLVAEKPVTASVRSLFQQVGLPEENVVDRLVGDTHYPRLILVTAHRRENFGAPLEQICSALKKLAEIYRDEIRIVYPVHLNPNVQEPVYRFLSNYSNISLLPPMDYYPFVQLLKQAWLVLTDSGGLQEEAPGLGVPVLVMRDVTERPEGVEAGTVRLVGTNMDKIVTQVCSLWKDPDEYLSMARAVNPYGDGQAAERIVQALLKT